MIPEVDGTKIGVVTEQGDLGLGFTELNEADQTAYKNAPVNNEEIGDNNHKE